MNLTRWKILRGTKQKNGTEDRCMEEMIPIYKINREIYLLYWYSVSKYEKGRENKEKVTKMLNLKYQTIGERQTWNEMYIYKKGDRRYRITNHRRRSITRHQQWQKFIRKWWQILWNKGK